MRQQTYKKALGIAVGDVVTTSYDTGPYYVWSIHGPFTTKRGIGYFAIWPYPVICLTLTKTDEKDLREDYRFSYINNIHRCDDGRWFTDQGDEIFVRKPRKKSPLQIDLFSVSDPSPALYRLQDGVRYDGGDGTVWKCLECDTDFNAEKTAPHNPFHCRMHPSLLFIVMGIGHWSLYQRAIGFKASESPDWVKEGRSGISCPR